MPVRQRIPPARGAAESRERPLVTEVNVPRSGRSPNPAYQMSSWWAFEYAHSKSSGHAGIGMKVGIPSSSASGAMHADLRSATAAEHQSVDTLIDPVRLVEIKYYAAVLRGLIEAAEHVELTLPLIPPAMCCAGLSRAEVSKRVAIDAEASFLDDLAGPRPVGRPAGADERLLISDSSVRATMTGLLYVYVGSGLGGLHLLRVARTAPWWRHDREHAMLRPYGQNLNARWRAVLSALARLDPDERDAAVRAARAGFAVHRRSLLAHLSAGGLG